MQSRRQRPGAGSTAPPTGHVVQPGLVRDPTALESITSTLQTWSPFNGPEPRRVASDRGPATSPAPVSLATAAAAVGYASDESSDEEDGGAAYHRSRPSDDDPTAAARHAVGRGAVEAIAWAKWDDLVGQDHVRRVLLIGYCSGGVALWDCSDLDSFVELLNLSSLPIPSEATPGLACKRRKLHVVDGALLATPKTATDPAVLVLLSRAPSSTSTSGRSYLIFYSLRTHAVLAHVAVHGIAHYLRINRRFIVVSTSSPLALHIFHVPRFDSSEVKLVPASFSPIRDVAPSSFDGAPVFCLGAGGRLLAYASTTPLRSSRLGGLLAQPGHGILARPGVFDSKSTLDDGRGSFGLSDAPEVARRVSEGVLGGVSALKEAGMSYWAQAKGPNSRDASPQTYTRPQSSQGSPIAYPRSAPASRTVTMNARPASSTVVVLDLLSAPQSASSIGREGIIHSTPGRDAPFGPKIIASFVPSADPISQLSFSPASTHLLVAADGAHSFDVFELKPATVIGQSATSTGPAADSGANAWHRYRLERGITSAHAREVSWSPNGRFVAVSTAKGTSHIYAIHPAGGLPLLEQHFGPHVVNSDTLPPLSLSLRASARVRSPATRGDDTGIPASTATSAALSARVAFIPYLVTAASSFAEEEGSAKRRSTATRSPPPLLAQDFLVFHPDSGNATLHRLSPQEVVTSPSLSTTTTNAVAAASRGEIGKLATTAVSGLTQLMRSRGANLVGGQTLSPRLERGETTSGSIPGTEKTWKVRCRSLAAWDLRRGKDWPEVHESIPARTSAPPMVVKRQGHLYAASAEIETSSRAPRVMPRSIYASRQFDFFALPPRHQELSAAGRFEVSGREIHFRPEVRVRQGTAALGIDSVASRTSANKQALRTASEFAPASFDQPIKSAMHAFLDPQTILAPGSPQLRPPTFPNGVPGKHGSWRDSIQVPRGVAPAALEGIERVRQSLGQIRVPKGMIPVAGRRRSMAGGSTSDLQVAYSTSISFEDEDAVFADRELEPSQSASTTCTTDLDEGRANVKSQQPASHDNDYGDFDRILGEDWDDHFADEVPVQQHPTVGESPESALEPTIGEFEHFDLELPSGIPAAMPTLAIPSPFALDPVDAGDESPPTHKHSGTTFANTPKDLTGLSEPTVYVPDLLAQSSATLATAIPTLTVPTNVALSASPASSVSSSPSSRSSGKRKKGRR